MAERAHAGILPDEPAARDEPAVRAVRHSLMGESAGAKIASRISVHAARAHRAEIAAAECIGMESAAAHAHAAATHGVESATATMEAAATAAVESATAPVSAPTAAAAPGGRRIGRHGPNHGYARQKGEG